MAKLFISQVYLQQYSTINDNVDYDLVAPIIRMTQELEIRGILGTNLYNLLISQLPTVQGGANSLTVANKILLDDYVLPCNLAYLMADISLPLKFRYMAKGIQERSGENSSPISTTDLKYIIDGWKNKAESYEDLLIRFIKQNYQDYPEYNTNTGIGTVRPRRSAFTSPIWTRSRLKDTRNNISENPYWGDERP